MAVVKRLRIGNHHNELDENSYDDEYEPHVRDYTAASCLVGAALLVEVQLSRVAEDVHVLNVLG